VSSHHNHNLDDVHYDTAAHNDYPAHHHEWAGNNHFNTVNDGPDDLIQYLDEHGFHVAANVLKRFTPDLIGECGYDITHRTPRPPG
jgi:hypothetical protein